MELAVTFLLQDAPEASREGKRWVWIRNKLQIGCEMEKDGLERVVGI